MVDLTPIKQYINEPSSFIEDFVPSEIKRIGLNTLIENDIKRIDCTRILEDGTRPMQTIGYPYLRVITELIYIINNYVDDSLKDDYFTRILNQHNANIEYEKLNPPIWYGGKKAKEKFEREYKPKKEKSNKPSATERKLAAKIAKINSLSIKIKPAN